MLIDLDLTYLTPKALYKEANREMALRRSACGPILASCLVAEAPELKMHF
jgi:hypothetical protein